MKQENEYQCAYCENIYEKGWSDEEAEKEVNEIWGEIPENERMVICDDCFNLKSKDEIKKLGNEYKTKK